MVTIEQAKVAVRKIQGHCKYHHCRDCEYIRNNFRWEACALWDFPKNKSDGKSPVPAVLLLLAFVITLVIDWIIRNGGM